VARQTVGSERRNSKRKERLKRRKTNEFNLKKTDIVKTTK
jgi:hypothetical protein